MKKNCFINGNGVVESGEYGKVEICGTGAFGSNVFADKIVINGSASIGENLKSGIIQVNGACSAVGSIKSNKIFVNGVFKSNNLNIMCESLKVNGEMKGMEGEIRAKNIDIVGAVFAKKIEGDFIKITAPKRNSIINFFKGKKEKSKIKYIEGKNIEINDASIKHIACENITIGKNCVIEFLECSGKAKIDKRASVSNIKDKFENK